MSSILHQNAYPLVNSSEGIFQAGYTKLEMAALLIASGLVAKYNMKEPDDQKIIAKMSCQLATEILYEANDVFYK